MNADWTVERLDALPEGIAIEWTETDHYYEPPRVHHCRALRHGGEWHDTDKDAYGSSFLIEDADPVSIRVVSVPIDALLADETVQVAEDAFVDVTHLAGPIRNEAEVVLRAAIEHVTGGACCNHPKCPGGSLCCCMGGAR